MTQTLSSPIHKVNGEYCVQGLPLRTLCETFGTPTYLYDLDYVVGRYQYLTSIFKGIDSKIHYAMKANYNPHLLMALRDAGAKLDTVSPAEVMLALELGFKKEDILYTANNMTDAEMRLLSAKGVLFNLDSLSGLKRYGQICPGTDVCVRFNADVVAGEHSKVQTGGDKTKFGVRLEKAAEARAIAKEHHLKIVGLHEHTGSGIADPALFVQGMRNLLAIANAADFPDLRFVDFGGGFKVRYKPDEKQIDYDRFGAEAADLVHAFCADYGRKLELRFEPGKFVAAEGGLLLLQVNSLIFNKERRIAGTDSGFSHLVRPVMYGAYHHILNVSNPGGPEMVHDICGNICETGDLFAEDRALPEIREGDFLTIMNAGAYGYSMASSYNLRPMPAEVVIQGGKAKLSRPRHSHEDVARSILADCKFS